MIKPRQRLGKYRLEKRLARGAFSEVFAAMDTVEGVRVALKVPYEHLLDRETLEHFRREVRLTARMDHPNVQLIKNAQFIDDHFVIAQPLGESNLAERMRRRMNTQTALRYIEQMLAAVAHAHENRIIHLDIKPENMILFPGYRLRLSDFGISRVARRTLEGSGSGTVGYLAPEQALGKPSFRSDVFALGLVVLKLLGGELLEWPFEWPPESYAKLVQKMHPELIDWLRKSLEVDQYERFEDGREMYAEFLRLKSLDKLHAPGARRKAGVTRRPKARRPKARRQRAR